LFGVSAKHLKSDVLRTVSRKDTTGSATFISVKKKKKKKKKEKKKKVYVPVETSLSKYVNNT